MSRPEAGPARNTLSALLVSYSFPPVGGAGVQRIVKLAKYLSLHGVRPSVLTVANPSVPIRDESLLADLPAGLEVTRVRTLEPAYGMKQTAWNAEAAGPGSARARITRAVAGVAKQVLFPDPQLLWQPAAHAALLGRIAQRRDDVLLISGPPFSQFLMAPLARAAGIGVVLDYRDEWSTLRTSYEMAASSIARSFGDPVEAGLLRTAHAIVTATDEFRTNLIARFPFLDAGRVHVVPNGYDPDDFPRPLPSPPSGHFVATYAGTVFTLTSARGLLAALRRLRSTEPDTMRSVRVRFVGRIVETEADAFEGTESLGVERVGYVPHREVLHVLASSHLTLCLLDDVPGTERIYPAKIFELMHLGRPILTLAPPHSALARLVESHGLGTAVHPRDESAIANALLNRIRESGCGPMGTNARRNASDIGRYDRRALAGEFAEILRDAAYSARRRGM